MIKLRIVQLVVEFASGPLKPNTSFTLKIFDLILNTRCDQVPGAVTYNGAVRELQLYCLHQLQRLALRAPDSLMVRCGEYESTLGFV